MNNTDKGVEFNPQQIQVIFDKVMKEWGEAKGKITDKLNILIVGQNSKENTLINAIFGDKLEEIENTATAVNNIKEIRIDDNLSIYKVKRDENIVKEFLEIKNSQEIEEQIHIAWIFETEITKDKKLYEILQENKIHNIVIHPRISQDEDANNDKLQEITKKGPENNKQITIQGEVNLNTKTHSNIKENKDIQELILKTYDLLPESKKAVFARKQKIDKQMTHEQAQKDAQSLIDKYSDLAAASCASPLPFSDMVLILSTQLTMIVHISAAYNLQLNRDNAKRVALALISVCGAGYGASSIGRGFETCSCFRNNRWRYD